MNSSRAITILLLIMLLASPACAGFDDKKRIFVLHSYHQGFHWTDRIMDGIKSVFSEHENVELYINYMDTKRRSSADYFERLKALYRDKYQFHQFDAIISSDDHALDFLLKYRDQLFPNTPVIFSGLNDFSSERLLGQKGYTGVYESYDVAGTLRLMLRLHPNSNTIAAITDNTRSGHIFKALVEKASKQIDNSVNIIYFHDQSTEMLVPQLKALPADALVLWAIYLRMPNGTTLTSKDSVKLVSESSGLPTYCVWDVVGEGVVGGKITSPNFQGEAAARLALRVIEGEPIDAIKVKGSPLDNIFDYNYLDHFNISLNSLPKNSIVLNKPDSFYDIYKRYIWIYSAITLLLIVTIIALVTIIILKKKRDQFEGLAMHDQLTGLYNRHYLFEVAAQKLSEAVRHKQPISLLMIDLDFFKKINDSHGHLVGDMVLKGLAKLLEEGSRSEDIVARIGGEEFVVLLDHCDQNEAIEKAQLIRHQIEQLNPARIPITASIGVSSLSTEKEDFAALLGRADKAVYQAKNEGRNRVSVYKS